MEIALGVSLLVALGIGVFAWKYIYILDIGRRRKNSKGLKKLRRAVEEGKLRYGWAIKLDAIDASEDQVKRYLDDIDIILAEIDELIELDGNYELIRNDFDTYIAKASRLCTTIADRIDAQNEFYRTHVDHFKVIKGMLLSEFVGDLTIKDEAGNIIEDDTDGKTT